MYQGVRSLDVMTLSPWSALSGIAWTLRVPEHFRQVVADGAEDALVEADEIDLVDGEHERGDAEEPRDARVPARLLAHAVGRVDEQDREVRRRRAGRHVARVLLVARACRRG